MCVVRPRWGARPSGWTECLRFKVWHDVPCRVFSILVSCQMENLIMLRICSAIGLAALSAGFLFHWVMGDEIGPFVSTAKESLRDQFVGMVDKYELELKKAEAE